MELLLSVAESAHRLGIGKTRFFELLKAEELHAVQLGGRTLIPIAELERFVAQLPPRTRSHSPRAASVRGTAMIKICLVTTTDSLDVLIPGEPARRSGMMPPTSAGTGTSRQGTPPRRRGRPRKDAVSVP